MKENEITPQEKNKRISENLSKEICNRTKIELSDWIEFMSTFGMRVDSNKSKRYLVAISIYQSSAIKSAYEDYKLEYELQSNYRNCTSAEKQRRFTLFLANAEASVEDLDADLNEDIVTMTSAYDVHVENVSDIEMEHEIKRLEDEIN